MGSRARVFKSARPPACSTGAARVPCSERFRRHLESMPRPIWTGSIAFGLVNVPVKVYSAVHQKEVRFHQLHDKDGGRIQFKRTCSKCGNEVPYENIVKGYELSPGRYVRIAPEELEALDPKATREI